MTLTDEDIKDLKSAIRVAPVRVYKGGYSLHSASTGLVSFLYRNGVKVNVDERSGSLTVERG